MIGTALALALAGPALAADVHLKLETSEGEVKAWTVPYRETMTETLGPFKTKKSSAIYRVSLQPSVFDPMANAFRLEFTVCREWTRKGKGGRYCDKPELLAPPEGAGPVGQERSFKIEGEKFSFTVQAWYTGEPPIPAGLPAPEPEPAPE